MEGTTVFHGQIDTLDPQIGRTRALAVRDGLILAHGAEAEASTGEHVTLEGPVLPGFVDAHTHHAMAGQIDLYEFQSPPTASLDELLADLAAYADNLPPEAWVMGGSWGAGLLGELSDPAVLGRLDTAAGGRPVMLRDDSKHNRWASSEALRRAGVTEATEDPEGGWIIRSQGQLTGVMLESAGILVERALARDVPPSTERLEASSERAIEMLHGYGITGFQDAAISLPQLHALHDLDASGRLKAWVVSSMMVNDFIFGADPLGEEIIAHREASRSHHHRPDFIKIFLDGIPPSRTGAFLEPYLPDPHGHCDTGDPTMTQVELEHWLVSSAERGIGSKVHCTGDASVRMVLDAAAVVRDRGLLTPIQVAHGQFIAEADIPRFATLDVTAEISPALWYPGVIPDAIATVLPPERATRMQPNRDLLDAGAALVVGSDWPVAVTPHVWEAIYGLVTRRDPSGSSAGTLWEEQAITREEAIRAYTVEGAKALRIDDVTGTLTPGKSADFVELSDDPWRVADAELPHLTPRSTWFAGERVHSKETS